MKRVELYARVRHAVQIEGISARAAADRFGINPRTVAKMLKFSVPPGYRRSKPPVRPKLDPFTGIIDAILAADRHLPKKQRHTSKRIFERLRDEHDFTGGITIVKDYVANWRLRTREMFVPLTHPPGHAQVDFGEAIGIVRDRVGPVAAFKTAKVVARLPKTRSGKILRATMRSIANGEQYKVPATIDDPATLDEISTILSDNGTGKD